MDRSKLIRRIVRMDRRAKGNQERRRKERKNEERGRERKKERGTEKGRKVNWRNVKEEWFDETHGRINSRNSRRRHSTAFSERYARESWNVLESRKFDVRYDRSPEVLTLWESPVETRQEEEERKTG